MIIIKKMPKILYFQKNDYICNVIKTSDMRNFYFSAAVQINSESTCVVGMKIITERKKVEDEIMKKVFKFGIEKYLKTNKMFAFGRITKKDFTNKTNITIKIKYQ